MARPRKSAKPAHPEFIWPGKLDASGARRAVRAEDFAAPFRLAESWPGDGDPPGRLYAGDNRAAMAALLEEGARFGAIYLDPPYNCGRPFALNADPVQGGGAVAYDDRWGADEASWHHQLWQRLVLARELLADDGLLMLHLDQRGSAHGRLMLDEAFGAARFVNEVVWAYKSGGASARSFARKHDTILVYAKAKDHHFDAPRMKSYNRGLKPYRFAGVEEFRDEIGWHTLVVQRDVLDIDMVGRTAAERTGYPTQKPLALLAALLGPTRGPVADFHAGSGTTAEAAHRLGRPWVVADASPAALAAMRRRFALAGMAFEVRESAAHAPPGPADASVPPLGEYAMDPATGRVLASAWRAPRDTAWPSVDGDLASGLAAQDLAGLQVRRVWPCGAMAVEPGGA